MGAFTDSGKNEMLDASTITHAALFNGDPSGAGTEISGGTYARQAITMATATSGAVTITTDETFDVPAGGVVNYIGYFTALTGGVLKALDDVTQETYTAAGQYVLESSTFSI